MSLTAAQQDYIEIIYQLEIEYQDRKLRITDIAERLGTKLPTVTRTVKKLTELGYIDHKSHGSVSLTKKGITIAKELVHLHKDITIFFTEILGLPETQASEDACQTEHALSPQTAQRIHEFLIYYNSLKPQEKKVITKFKEMKRNEPNRFTNIPKTPTTGWRS
ncbi:MAG: metal-dependent transcriptional regulator [Calditrichaeota bacterium]|nr:MAG: metal-dependent transcriptional regulator [Calditrichota bacterium]